MLYKSTSVLLGKTQS